MNNPIVSVVMAVHNGATELKASVQSVLSQTDVDFEFIIVNDGSTDQSATILNEIEVTAPSVFVLDQERQGLTKALINGCALAKGEYIARQDNGDISLRGRLKCQLDYLKKNPEVSMLSCATRFVTPSGETVYTVSQSETDAKNGLKQTSMHTLSGPPHHGSVMFRRDAYIKVGGYRAEFQVAQDIDLWSRLVEVGEHHSIMEIYYQAVVAKNSISMLKRKQQIRATEAIIDCINARQSNGNENDVLATYAATDENTTKSVSSAMTDSAYYYFLGSNLFKSNREASQKYLRMAVSAYPWHWKARTKLIAIFFSGLSSGIFQR